MGRLKVDQEKANEVTQPDAPLSVDYFSLWDFLFLYCCC